MLDREQLTRINPKLRTIQIICGALVLGSLAFTLVVSVLIDWRLMTGEIKLLTLIGAVTGLMLCSMAMIVPRLITSSPTHLAAQLLSKSETGEVSDATIIDASLENLQTNRILFYALIEGAIFLNLMTFLLEQSAGALVIVGIGFALMVFAFPFTGRLTGWIEQNLTDIRREMRLLQ